MEFNKRNYSAIREACTNRKEIEFFAPITATVFEGSKAPEDWTSYPPCMLPPDGYAQVFVHSGNDAKGSLTKLELLIHLDGGLVLYKAIEDQKVGIKVTWPKS